jgi:hypothetical protein
MGFWKIWSREETLNKREEEAREKRAEETLIREPFNRVRAMKLQGPVLAYACALILGAKSAVNMLVADDYPGIPAIKEVWDKNS